MAENVEWGPDSDEEVRRAIGLSLQPPTPTQKMQEVISLIDSDGEDDVESSVGHSRASSVKSPQRRLAQPQSLLHSVSPPQISSATGSREGPTLGGLTAGERTKLEQERLARRQKNMGVQSTSPSRVSGSMKRGRDEPSSPGGSSGTGGTSARPTKAQKTEEVSLLDFYGEGSTTGSESPAPGSRGPGPRKLGPKKLESVNSIRLGSDILEDEDEDGAILYPAGVVKKTNLEGAERKGDDITIDEVLQKDTLRMGVLSAFMWDPTWILDKIDVRNTKLILVMQAKEEEEKERLKKMFSVLSGLRLIFPDMSGQINSIPTANLVKFDWGGHNGIMENTVFIIDLPRLPRDHEPLEESELTHFARELIYFCKKKGYPDTVLNALHLVDYSKTAQLAFVHSIGGSHYGDDWKRTGYPGLAAAVRALGLQSRKGLMVDYVTSSIGALNKVFLTNLYRAVMGDNGLKELQSRGKKSVQSNRLTFASSSTTTGSSSTSKGDNEPTNVDLTWEVDIRDKFNVYFPTHETVAQSKGGTGAGGTVCFQRQWWDAPTFPKEVLRDCVSTRAKVLMHNKLLFARPARQIKTENGVVDAYAYVGSANLSESAWGKLVMDRLSKSPKLNVKNWECGVLIPVVAPVAKTKDFGGAGAGRTWGGGEVKDDAQEQERQQPLGMEVFAGSVPVPMQVPARRIAAGRVPWFYTES